VLAVGRFYVKILSDLPNLDDLEGINSFAQASQIVDRNGKELYKIFEENRQYVGIDAISPVLQDAIVATEDETFWDNAGVDFYGFAKAGIICVVRGTNHPTCRGASTITQQLIKNIYLTNEVSYVRKLKEIVLALRLKTVLEKEVKKTDPSLAGADLQEAVKKKVLELYLNYIFLGNNSYGVESASNNYFATGANHLDIIEASILAGIPQAPGRYNVYTNRDDVMWYLRVKDSVTGEEVLLVDDAQKQLYVKAASIFTDKDIKAGDANAVLEDLRDSLKFDYSYGSGSYTVEYIPGRKDEVLARMFDTKVITAVELKQAVLQGFTYEFKRARIGLTAPHFVFRVKELLESADNKYLGNLDSDILYQGGLTITTSLDLEIQKMAEKAVRDNIKSINGYGAGNTALIHMDSIKWDIIAYVGSADFNDLDIKGQNDMVRAPIQPWSSIKPFFYSLGFMKLPLTLDTQIFDIRFAVGDYDPQNADGSFMWPLPLRKALAYSRNIPAIKMYFAAGQQEEFIQFAKKMGVQSLNSDASYGPSMAIGSAEMQMLELANLYGHLSAQGKPGTVDPILEIRAKDGTIIYKKEEKQQEQVIPSGVAYLMWKILSDPANLPPSWINQFKFPWISFAHKTGTSNIRTKDGKRLPKDGWLATYTPSKVTLFWAGNTTPKAMNPNAFGWWMNNGTWKQFWGDLKKWWYLTDEMVAPTEVKNVTIAKNSGKLAWESTPEWYRINTMAFINTAPTQVDVGVKQIQVDSLCYGKVSDLTPAEDIVPWYISTITSFMPNNMDLDTIMTYLGANQWSLFNNEWAQSYTLFSTEPEQTCVERESLQPALPTTQTWVSGWDVGIGTKLSIVRPANNSMVSNNFSLWYTATSKAPIASATIFVNGKEYGTYNYASTTITDTKTINIDGAQAGTTHEIEVKTTDAVWVVTSKVVTIKLQANDSRPPYIIRPNTKVVAVNGWYAVTLVFSDLDSSVKGWVITQWGKQLMTFEWSEAKFTVTNLWPLGFTVNDFYDNMGEWVIDVSSFVWQ